MKKTRYYFKLAPKTQMGHKTPPLKEWVFKNAYQFRYANNVYGKMKDTEEFRYYYDKKTNEFYSYQRPVLMFADEWETRGFDACDVLIDKIVEVDLAAESRKKEQKKNSIEELKKFQKKRRAAINKEKRLKEKQQKARDEMNRRRGI